MSIDLKNEIQKFKPVNLSDIPGDSSQQTEDIRKSISLYNNALKKIRSKSEDIAIIELKKAVALNPKFSEAIILLGLCYMLDKDYENAIEMFRRAENTERGRAMAAKYIEVLEGDNQSKNSSPKKNHKKEKKKPSESKTVSQKKDRVSRNLSVYQLNTASIRRRSQHSFTKYLLASLIVICTAVLILAVIGIIDSIKSNENAQGTKTAISTTKKNNTRALDQKTVGTNNSDVYKKQVQKLDEAERLIAASEYEAAGDILVELKNFNFVGQDKQRYEQMANDVFPKAAWSAYVKAEADFNNANYQSAVNNFKKMLSYGNNWDYVPTAMYHYGMSYMYLQDYNNNLTVFNDLRNRFPQSEFAEYAGYRINDINALQGNTGYQQQQNVQEQPAQQQPQANTPEQQTQTPEQEQRTPNTDVQTPGQETSDNGQQKEPQKQEQTGTGTEEVPETNTEQEQNYQDNLPGENNDQPTTNTDIDRNTTN